MFVVRQEARVRPSDEKYLEMVVNALALLRNGKEHTRFELFPDAGADLRTFQKNVLKAFVDRGVALRIEGGDPQSPTVKFVVKSRQALERLSEDDDALAKIVNSAWPTTAVSDKPPPLELVEKYESPPPVELPIPAPRPQVVKQFVPPPPAVVEGPGGLKEEVEKLSKIVNAEGQSVLYIRERLDELCRYLAQVLPPLEEKVTELHKEWKGEK